MSDRPSVGREIDLACDRFEAAWNDNAAPEIAEFLLGVSLSDPHPESRNRLLIELIVVDLHHRLQRGDEISVEAYLKAFPELVGVDGKPPRRLLVEEELLRSSLARRSEGPSGVPAIDAGQAMLDQDPTKPHSAQTDYGGDHTDVGGPYEDHAAVTSLPRRSIDDYDLISEIARGGMGVVYKAFDTRLKCHVALKMIRSGEFAGRELIERFYSEAEAAAKLQHPGIVRIHRVGEVEGLHYFTMDFIEGSSLASLAAENALSESEVVRLSIEVCEAVEYAHQRGIVHRDIKPSNVLVDESGRALVTDFGLAKQLSHESDISHTGQALGTPGYMPPEQAEGRREEVGFQSDVYSIGALIYHLLTGHPPFEGRSHGEVITKVLHAEPVPPQKLNPSVSRDLNTICMKCLEKPRERRYISAAELRDELRRYSQGFPIQARPVSRTEHFWRWCRRNKMVASLASATCLAVVVGGVGGGLEHYKSEQSHSKLGEDRLKSLEIARLQLDGEIKSAELTAELSHQALIPQRVGLDADKLAAALANYERARAAWQEFSMESVTDLQRQRQSAEALFLVAQAARLLGDANRSEELFANAVDTFRQLAGKYDIDADLGVKLGKSLDYLGELYRDQGRMNEAESVYRESLDVLTQCHSQFPGHRDGQMELARTNNNYGILLQDTGRITDAQDCFDASENALRQLVAQASSSTEYRRDLARTLINKGRLKRKNQDYGDAEKLYREAIAEFDRLLESDPNSARDRFLGATTKMNLGYMLAFSSGDLDAGEICLQEANAEFAKLPMEIQEYRFNQAKCLLNLGSVNGARSAISGEKSLLATAKKFCSQAKDELSKLNQAAPDVAEFESWMGIVNGNLGAIADGEGDYEAFASFLNTAIQSQQKAHNKHPENEDYKDRLKGHLRFLALQILRNHLDEESESRKAVALKNLVAAMELGYQDDFVSNPLFDPLRDSPEFQSAMKRLDGSLTE